HSMRDPSSTARIKFCLRFLFSYTFPSTSEIYTLSLHDALPIFTKAIKINEQFQVSKQFWSYLVKKGLIEDPDDFIMPLPHIRLVHGEKNVEFLKKRYQALSENPLFQGMEFSDDHEKLEEWIPLVMKDRTADEPIAATKIDGGTDVNFGALTSKLLENLQDQDVNIHYQNTVEDIQQTPDGTWEVKVRNFAEGTIEY